MSDSGDSGSYDNPTPYGYWSGGGDAGATWIPQDAPAGTGIAGGTQTVVDPSQIAYSSAPNYEGTPTQYYDASNNLIGYLGHGDNIMSTSGLNFVNPSNAPIDKYTQIQATDTNGNLLFVDPNNEGKTTTTNTGIPYITNSVAGLTKTNAPSPGIFQDPLFRNFLISAAAMGGAAALAPAAGSVGTAEALGSAGDFLAADAAATQAGASQFALADALGMPLDQAVTSGLIGADGALTPAGEAIMSGVDAAGQTGMAANAAAAGATPSWLSSALSGLSPSSLLSLAKSGLSLGSLGSGILSALNNSKAGGVSTTAAKTATGYGTGAGGGLDTGSNAPPGGTASSFGGEQLKIDEPWRYGSELAGMPVATPVAPPTTFTPTTLNFAEGGEVSDQHSQEHVPEFYSEGGLKHTYAKGGGDGTSDSVPAMLATGEFVIPADVVAGLGNGDNEAGAGVLDKFLVSIREHKRSTSPEELPPDSKGPLEYLAEAYNKARA